MQNLLKNAYAGSPEALGLLLLQIVLFGASLNLKLFAQEPPRKEINLDQFISELFPLPSEDSDNAELYESLYQLYASPLDLNTATSDELAATLILSEKQLKSIFDYRARFGPFLSLYELQAVPDLDLPTIRRLLPFVTVHAERMSLRESIKNPGQHFLMFRSSKVLEKQKGFRSIEPGSQSRTRYEGSPFNGYLRYRNARAGAYSFGITIEKDAGEKLWNWSAGRQIFGIDFTSFHAQIMNRGKLKNLVIGDFQLQTGQGMVLGAGFSLGKGAEVIKTTYRSTLGVKPYTSAMEANFFRGAAATFTPFNQLETTVFYSKVKRDATQELGSKVDNEMVTTSLPVTGYHRTQTEIDKHNNFSEQNIGLHLFYKLPKQRGQIGLTALHTLYNTLFRKREAEYNRFEFSGRQNFVAGLHCDLRWRNFHCFGESSISKSGGTGILAGLIAGLGKKFDATILGRRYSRTFHPLYGNAFAETSRPINEAGIYTGLRFAPNRHWQLSGFYDFFRFPWLKYQIDAPSKGYDYYLHLLWKPNKRLNAYVLFHEKHKQRNDPDSEAPMATLVNTAKRTAMINLEYEIPMRFSLRSRIQYGDFRYQKISTFKGLTILQDFTWHLQRLELSARLAWFKTDDYDSRQYVYEKDLLYAFSIPAYYDAGTRHYLLMRYTVSKHLKLWARWSQTRYKDLETISSGLNEIDGNKRSELKAQVMYQF